jgi:general stress protein YciG
MASKEPDQGAVLCGQRRAPNLPCGMDRDDGATTHMMMDEPIDLPPRAPQAVDPSPGMAASPAPPAKRPRGFAAMDPALRREIARKGGRSVPARKRSFARDPALAAEAGRKGGARGAPPPGHVAAADPLSRRGHPATEA